MKAPGPAHPITIEPASGRVLVRFAGETVADTRRALTLREATLPPVFYIPRDDTRMDLLERTARTTHCPFKGDAAYYSIRAHDGFAENAVWTYEEPFSAVNAIAGRLAFYPNKVDITEA